MFILFNLDPVAIHLGGLQIRYYSFIFAGTFLIGYLIWRHQITSGGYPKELAQRFLLWAFIATIVGGRIGEYIFYSPEKILTDPSSMLYIWRGGLSSHGVMLGVIIALALYAAKHRIRTIELFDHFSMPAALGAATVRLGNFFNSEIVGRATDVPWGVKFMRYDGGRVVRHPSQLYESALGFCVLAVLAIAYRKTGKEHRPSGLLTGLFFTLYFLGRFFIEFYKEPLVLPHSPLTMGQYLSIVPFFCGVVILIRSFRNAPG